MCFVRGERGLCRSMIRQKIKGTKVRRSLTPEEEPNFYMPHWGETKAVDTNAPCKLASPPVKSSIPADPPKPKSHKKAVKNAKQSVPTSQNNSLVSMIREAPHQSGSTLLPPPPVIKQRLTKINTSEVLPLHPMSQGCARGGDLLFFEGQPFRYLEHIEQIPPIPSQGSQFYKDKLHNMINSIVMDSPSWQEPAQNICSV